MKFSIDYQLYDSTFLREKYFHCETNNLETAIIIMLNAMKIREAEKAEITDNDTGEIIAEVSR